MTPATEPPQATEPTPGESTSATDLTQSAQATPGTQAAPSATPGPRATSKAAARERTRTSVAFNSLLAGAIVLILLLVFILENTQSVKISFFGAGGHISLGIALLFAAIGGALLTGLAGWARVLQLRHRMKHPKV